LFKGDKAGIILIFQNCIPAAQPNILTSPSFSLSEREGAVLHCKSKLFVLPNQFLNNAEQRRTANLLAQKAIIDFTVWSPSPLAEKE
jgi:hypothetical protein